MERNRQKLVGWDKGSLTEQQTKGIVTTTIPIRRIHKTKQQSAESNSQHLPPLRAQLHPTGTQHDGTWYGIPCSVWPGGVSPSSCVPSWSLGKINPVLAKPRTPPLKLSDLR